jgi:hypothetical protein
MANILLDKSHKKLIQSAIDLGDWLLSLDGLSEQDSQAIKAVQKALNKLPKVNDGTLAMYGFSLEQGNELAGLVRGWDISLEYFANDPEQQGGLEMFSSYIPIPESTDPDVLAEKKNKELYFHWPIGDICNLIPDTQSKQWLQQLASPKALAESAERLRVEIVFADYYGEVELPVSALAKTQS